MAPHTSTLASFLLLAATQFHSTHAFFRLASTVLVQERADPLKAAGKFSAHVHTVMGGYNFGTEVTYESLQASKCTSSGVKEDKSAYWVPMVYFHHKNGSFIAPDPHNQGMSIYYGFGTNQGRVEFPKGFRMIAGNSFARSYNPPEGAKQWTEFECLGASPGKTTDGFPKVPCPGKSRLNVFFPTCGNGKTDSDDHMSHVKYRVNGKCPEGFNHYYPELHYELWWSNTEDPKNGIIWDDAADPKQPFVLSSGDPTGFGFHGDFANGWDEGVLGKALKDCSGKGSDGNTGDGRDETCKHFTVVDAGKCSKEGNSPDLDTKENIYGWLDKLPGCNPITKTEEEARANGAKPCKNPSVTARRSLAGDKEPSSSFSEGSLRNATHATGGSFVSNVQGTKADVVKLVYTPGAVKSAASSPAGTAGAGLAASSAMRSWSGALGQDASLYAILVIAIAAMKAFDF